MTVPWTLSVGTWPTSYPRLYPVEDLARAHLLTVEASQPGHLLIYNLGNGAGFSVREVVETARRVTGRPIPAHEAPRRSGDPPILVASSLRIQAELGWVPHKPELGTIIEDAWRWIRMNAEQSGDGRRGRLRFPQLAWPLPVGYSRVGRPPGVCLTHAHWA